MRYSIQTISKVLGVPASTLRYYDKEGLLPFVEKTASGTRQFKDEDIEWLLTIECLKQCGMKIADIAKYIALCKQGDSTLNERYQMLQKLKADIKAQIEFLNDSIKRINFKLAIYQDLLKIENAKSIDADPIYSFKHDANEYIDTLHKMTKNKAE